ncbi:MAG: hypothetical protein R3342_03865 [Lutibacter sp.]|uniref:hypothetical protein n=1 Tax=Lutibacter sp. TaxID=1925666 RepID=UPI00299CEF5E|nr:hypothetical protein [Lutibacter sp.]MDX1828664.1 hypothetical protein [Lutibacter sp.]
MNNKKSQKLILLGIIILAIIPVINHYLNISDYIYGGLIGIASGITILGLKVTLKNKKHTSI